MAKNLPKRQTESEQIMNKHDANNAFEQQVSNEKLARHKQLIVEEAKACNAPLEQYELGLSWHLAIEVQAKAAEREKYEAEQAHHKEEQRKASIRNASVSELMRSLVAKAPTELFPDVQTYRTTGALSSRLIDWISHANNNRTCQ